MATSDLVGQRLAHFRLDALLGQGGMGVVYRATDERLRRTVAVKVLTDDFSGRPERRSRFLREARLAAAVSHPNIAAVHEIGEVDGRIFIAMELVEGTSLRECLDADRFPLARVLAIARGIVRGLARAHEKGVVHRDLKPDNVMVGTDDEVKILDFGLAKQAEGDAPLGDPDTASFPTEDGRILGTPGYMSPEQAMGKPVDHRTDLFSLGAILYEMASGVRPFRGATLEMLLAVVRDDPPPASAVDPRVPPELDRIISSCLAKLPEARYPSARALGADLDRWEASSTPDMLTASAPAPGITSAPPGAPSASASPSSSLAPTSRSVSPAPTASPRNRVLGLLTALACVAAAAAMWSKWKDPKPPPAPPAEAAVTTLTDLTLPATARPAAVAAYRAGLQLERDGADTGSWYRYEEAAAADPTLAQPHLRLALWGMRGNPDLGREHLARAMELRATLATRDLALLDAVGPCLRGESTENAECARRLEAAAARYPRDAEMQCLLGESRFNAGLLEESLAPSARALALDSGYADVYVQIGYVQAYLGRRDEALRSFARCEEASPSGASCLWYRDDLHAEAGRCDLLETDALKFIGIGPSLARGYQLLAEAYAARERPAKAVREAIRQQLARTAEAERASVEAEEEARLDVLEGDFAAAEHSARKLAQLAEGKTAEEDHAVPARLLVELYEETGRRREAADIADDFLARHDAWIVDKRGDDFAIAKDPTPRMLAAQLHAGRRTPAAYRDAIAAYVARWKTLSPPFYARYLWLHGYADLVESPAEARAALAALPAFEPLPGFRPGTISALGVGKTRLFAGHTDEALPELEQATRHCASLRHPFEHVRAQFQLGRARELQGNVPAACAAYRIVLTHWGKARPRSLTAEEAVRRLESLHCPANTSPPSH